MSLETEPREQLALVLGRNGMQRTTARLLAAFLFTERPALTMGDLVDEVGVSTGSASTGIRTLVNVGLVEQAPAPGSRRAHYRMRDDAWATLYTNQNEVVRGMRAAAEAGIAASPRKGPARARLESMRDFYDFVQAEMPALIERWRLRRGQAVQPPPPRPPGGARRGRRDGG